MINLNNQSNSSNSSIHSREKELPPIPKDTGSNKLDDSILKAKTLNRKNFKKLQLTNDSEESNIQNIEMNSLKAKRSNLRSMNLSLNLNGASNFQNSGVNSPTSLNGGKYINPPSNRSSLSSTSSLNISQRNIDPDSVSSTDNIINQISTLELNQLSHKSKFIRKRQTVISSISPTKSTSSMNSNEDLPNTTTSNSLDTSSPIYSTTSSIKLNNRDLVTLKELGSGNSGIVSKVLHIPTQKIMAKKIIPIELKLIIQNQIIRELKILHECQSPYIIEFYGAFINTNNTIVICMEYCNCSSLDKILNIINPKQFPLLVLKKLTYSILKGLVYLYENHKIIHRDIKPSNVLMTHKGQFKLCDFGVSRELTNSLAKADTFVGTSTYMSPERIQGLEYGIKSDIWSMGLMLIELASGKSIWQHDNKFNDNDNDNNDDSKNNDNDNDNSISNSSDILNPGPEGILDLLQRIVNEEPPSLSRKTNPCTSKPYDPELCKFIDLCLIKDDNARKSPWELLALEDVQFLNDMKNPSYDKELKVWAKTIRHAMKEKSDRK